MKEENHNFIDPITKETFIFSKYSISFKGDKTIYKNNGDQIVNPKTKTVLEFVERPFGGWPLAKMNFTNASPDEKKKMLKKRSQEHNKKHTPNHKDKGFNGY